MEKIFFIVCLITVTIAAPIDSKNENTILQYSNSNDGSGLYSFSFETNDGIKRNEHSSLKESTDTKKSIFKVTGSFSYIGPDGFTYETKYVADENGFLPKGKRISPVIKNIPNNSFYALAITGNVQKVDNLSDANIPKQ